MAKYSAYIELSPHYESVVDLDSEERNPNLWQEYIVHEDMKTAVEKICESLKYEHKDARRSFWIHGAYGTGKSYAAIVLKHLFEDSIPNIDKFLSKQMLFPYRQKYMALREKGDYLVVWKSGCTDIKSGTQLMMEMEIAIRNRLKAKFGDNAYYGHKSLTDATKYAVNDTAINWNDIFDNSPYGLSEEYDSFDEFRNEVLGGNLKACSLVATIYRERGWGLFAVVDTFEEWIKDIIAGNNLAGTGIVFIWDEFTGFLRDCGDDNVLQRLSELCKQSDAPLFMCLIVHRDPSWVDALGGETYARILHRYHELEFHISESAAYELIGDSILVRTGMDEQWMSIKTNLMKSISKNISDFDNLDMNNKQDRLRQLFPLHPMTLSLLTIVAQNFGASQRTLFRFMKDQIEAEQNVGFLHYINTFGPDDWCWLTPDFLWDYFFTRESDIRDFSPEARRAYQHFVNCRDFVANDEYAMHVFKASILLIAVLSTESISNLYSQRSVRKISATKNTLYKCFAGKLEKNHVDRYLDAFEESGILRLDKQANGDARLELPYTGNTDVFDVRLEQIRKRYTRYELYRKNGIFSRSIEEKMWDKTKATYQRMQICACCAEMNSVKTRLGELKDDLASNAYKIGLLVVGISELSDFAVMQEKLKSFAAEDKTGRLVICLLKEPLKATQLERWYNATTHRELAAEEGKKGSAEKYETEANIIVEEWSVSAAGSQITAFHGANQYPSLYGVSDLANRIEKDIVFSVFPAAPEQIVTQSTAFKRAQESAATAGITRTSTSAQLSNIANGIKAAQAWDAGTIDDLEKCDATAGARAVAALTKHLREQLSKGAKLRLDQLWLDLQKPPFGYYNSLACAYLLGYVLRFYVNGEFNWVNSDNNTFPLTEKNLATMVYNMCQDKVVNNTLSSGSEIWQKFKPYAQKVFRLDDNQAVNEQQARKYMRDRMTDAGVPFWALKYLPEENLGGAEAKNNINKMIDSFCQFISEQGDQESVMDEVITLFHGRGHLRKTITDAFADSATGYRAFRLFIFAKQPQISDLCKKIELNDNDLFDSIKGMMQGFIYTWTEEQVIAKLDELAVEYQLILTLNTAMRVSYKSVKQFQKDLGNSFDNMVVPGTVIETMDFSWLPALRIMRQVSKTGWSNATAEQKQDALGVLQTHAEQAWGYISAPKSLLSAYMSLNSFHFTDEELDGIFSELKALPYDTPVIAFKSSIQAQLDKVSYARNRNRLSVLWEEQSGCSTVSEWCRNYVVPIQWVVDDAALPYITALKSIQDGKRVDPTELHNAVVFFECHDSTILQHADLINSRFFAQVGANYQDVYEASRDVLLSRIRIKLTADPYAWAHKVGEIQNIIHEYIIEQSRSKYQAEAHSRILSMSEHDLRTRILKLLDQNPELYKHFLE